MEQDLFSIEWRVDQAGYRLVEEPAVEGRTILESRAWDMRLVRNGGLLQAYRPLQDEPGLFREFAETVIVPSDFQQFANRYGPLVSDEKDLDSALHALDAAGALRSILAIIDYSGDRQALARAADQFNHSVSGIKFMARVTVPEEGRPTIELDPGSLEAVLWFQLAGQITNGTAFRRCLNCPKSFPYGRTSAHPGSRAATKRKLYCSDRCRVAWNRRKA